MRRVRPVLACAAFVLAGLLARSQEVPSSPAPPPPAAAQAVAPAPPPASPPPADPAEDAMWDAAAKTAWSYLEARTTPLTGFSPSTTEYSFVTAWDIGSVLGATYSAHHLGLLTRPAYQQRMARLLRTLERLPLYDGAAFNKSYSARGSRMDRNNERVGEGSGWSAIDLGRLLLWMHIVAESDPAFAESARRGVARLDVGRITRDGYLRGASVGSDGRAFDYQEGKIGYEQYSARGYAAWGMPVENAMRLDRHAVPATFGGHRILLDDRGHDRLTSEPLVLAGLETGWTPGEAQLAEAVLALQDDRWRRTGQVTMVSEDASQQPPHHFYYYCIYAYGRLFPVVIHDHDAMLDGPRWVSTKAAFAWHALRRNEHTRAALEALAKARGPRGWSTGLAEQTSEVVGPVNLNTQAVILEAALYRRLGRPIAQAGQTKAAAASAGGAR
jgi:hypothetical protein